MICSTCGSEFVFLCSSRVYVCQGCKMVLDEDGKKMNGVQGK